MEKYTIKREYTKEEIERIRQELEALKVQAWAKGGVDVEVPFIHNLLLQIKDRTIIHNDLEENLIEARRKVLQMQDNN